VAEVTAKREAERAQKEAEASKAEAREQRLRKKIDKKRTATTRQVLEWVANNLGMHTEDIDPASVPCWAAYEIWKLASQSPERAWAFYTTLWAKVIPAKGLADTESAFADDGRKQLDLLDQFMGSWDDPRAQASG
jgi:hypothetical protein